MRQTRRQAMIETAVGTTIGFLISWVANWALWKIYDIHPTFAQSFWITVLFTGLSLARVYLVRRAFDWVHHWEWDRWITNRPDESINEAVLFIKHLVHIERWGFRIDLHKIPRADGANYFHSHPAHAIRIVLWGGYAEEVIEPVCCDRSSPFHWEGGPVPWDCCGGFLAHTYHRVWPALSIGWIRPSFRHRIAELLGGPSYSLWIRFRCIAPIYLCSSDGPLGEYYERRSFVQEEPSG